MRYVLFEGQVVATFFVAPLRALALGYDYRARPALPLCGLPF
jgi:hypothetical protein